MEKTLYIELHDYSYDCGEGCCTTYGTITKVNGEELPLQNQDVSQILQQVLEHLGYDVTILETYDYQ